MYGVVDALEGESAASADVLLSAQADIILYPIGQLLAG